MSFTVKAQQGGSTASGTAIRVKVLLGAAPGSGQGGSAGTATQHATAAQQVSITTTVTGSQVYGATWVASASTFTANGSSTYFDNIHESDGLTHGSLRSASATGTPGAVTLGSTAPSANGSIALLEILADGTITEDASGPAFVYGNTTSATTASFQPPPGALLVAMVSANGGVSTETMTVSDTSGTGIAWTEGVKINPAGGAYAGVWFAQFPPGPAPVTSQYTGFF